MLVDWWGGVLVGSVLVDGGLVGGVLVEWCSGGVVFW